ncbi:hypothetical protein ARMSODRAFT_1026233 [Armillaria solidipes]|uniref:Uncharacterized protein n=1 Tax=Armillaria solidipes TaxID=1076256 RepID=A0A2H3APR7_9AGAR|nr:hypothetical protein ARMSODRAFT_1026233 [Armillaria solidipes]
MPPHPKMLHHADAPVPKHRMPTLGQSICQVFDRCHPHLCCCSQTYSQTGPGVEHSGSNHTYPPLPDSNASSSPFSQTGPGLPGQFPNKVTHGDPSCSHAHSEPPYPLKHSSSPAPCENSSKALASPALPLEDHRSSLTIRIPGSAKRGRHELSEEAEDTGSEVLVQKILTDPHGYESEPGLDKRNGGGKGRQKEKRQGTRVLTRVISRDDVHSKSTITQLHAQLEGVHQKQLLMEAELRKATAEAGIATANAEASNEKVCLANVMAAQAMARMEQSKEGELQERKAQEAHEKRLQELEDMAARTREEVERSKEEAHQERVAQEAHEKTNQDRSRTGVGVTPVDPALSPLCLSGGGAGESGPVAGRGREDVDMTGGEAQERNLGAESSAVELQPGAIQLDEDFKMAGDEQEHYMDNEGDGSSKPHTLELRINHSMKMKGKGIVGGKKIRAGGGPRLYLLSEPASTPWRTTPPHFPIQPASMPNNVNRLPSLCIPSNNPFCRMPNAPTSQPVVNPFQRTGPSDDVMQPANNPQVDQKPTAEGNGAAFPASRCGHNDSNGALDGHGDAQPPSATQTLDMHAIATQLKNMKAMWAMNMQLIMELQQEYAGRRPSHRGPVVFKQPPVCNHDQDRTLMLGIVRREMNELMGIVRNLQVINVEHATHEEVESFDLVGEPKPSLQGMRVYWSNLKVGWNNELEEKFIQAFRVKYPDVINSAAKETVVHDMYFDRLTRLKKALILFGQREGEQEEEHEARILQQLNAKLYHQCPNTRRATTYEDCLEISKANSKLDDGQPDVAWLSIQGIVTVLKAGGMSSDESDADGDGNEVFHVKCLEWRSSEIDGIMDIIDADYRKLNAYGNHRARNPRRKCTREGGGLSGRGLIQGYPLNYYNAVWYSSLSS